MVDGWMDVVVVVGSGAEDKGGKWSVVGWRRKERDQSATGVDVEVVAIRMSVTANTGAK
jgi:hypothetical protein